MTNDEYEELEAKIAELEETVTSGLDEEGQPLTEEQIKQAKDALEEAKEDLKEAVWIDKYGMDAYNGVSDRDFFDFRAANRR